MVDPIVQCGYQYVDASSFLEGEIVLPAELRHRLGMGAGARIEVFEESDGLKLRVVRSVVTADMTSLAGMVKAPARGVPRSLED